MCKAVTSRGRPQSAPPWLTRRVSPLADLEALSQGVMLRQRAILPLPPRSRRLLPACTRTSATWKTSAPDTEEMTGETSATTRDKEPGLYRISST